MREEISKTEWVLFGMVLLVVFIILLFIYNIVKTHYQDIYIHYSQAPKITEAIEIKYALKTQINEFMVKGHIVALDPVSLPELKTSYSYIEKITEQYNLHTRVVSYKCGDSTCTRTEVYYTWDHLKTEKYESKQYTINGIEIGWICTDNISRLDLSSVYIGDNKLRGDNYIYYGWGDDKRDYYRVVPIERDGIIFVSQEGCHRAFANDNFQVVVDSQAPPILIMNIISIMVLIFVFIILIFLFLKLDL